MNTSASLVVFDNVGGERDYSYTVKGVISITGKRNVEEVLSNYLCACITSAVDYAVNFQYFIF